VWRLQIQFSVDGSVQRTSFQCNHGNGNGGKSDEIMKDRVCDDEYELYGIYNCATF
jgi:hypothetical protein